MWNYKQELEKLGHEVFVVNRSAPEDALSEVMGLNADVIHIHDETKLPCFTRAFRHGSSKTLIVTTHDPIFFHKPNPWIKRFADGEFFVGCLSPQQLGHFQERGVDPSRLLLMPNGASSAIRFAPEPSKPGICICLGLICKRKGQQYLAGMDFVEFAGPIDRYDPIEPRLVSNLIPNWDGIWLKEEVYDKLTNYQALVLLSSHEAAPLVVPEALMAGLDVIVSEAASANLDTSLPFIKVVPQRSFTNRFLVEMTIDNQLKRPPDRVAVRRHAEQNFDWSVLAKRYEDAIVRLTKGK